MPPVDFSKLHILTVEDDATTRHLISTVLQSAGARITAAESGSDALAKLASASRVVDVILCDYNMPSGNGLQLLKAIRSGQIKSVRPDTCFVMITSESATETIKLAAFLDVNGYLLKPVTASKMKAAIEKARTKYFPVNPPLYATIAVPESDM